MKDLYLELYEDLNDISDKWHNLLKENQEYQVLRDILWDLCSLIEEALDELSYLMEKDNE